MTIVSVNADVYLPSLSVQGAYDGSPWMDPTHPWFEGDATFEPNIDSSNASFEFIWTFVAADPKGNCLISFWQDVNEENASNRYFPWTWKTEQFNVGGGNFSIDRFPTGIRECVIRGAFGLERLSGVFPLPGVDFFYKYCMVF